MAYLRVLVRKCQESGCGATATFELVSQHNDALGTYCPKHAHQRLHDQGVRERRDDRARAFEIETQQR